MALHEQNGYTYFFKQGSSSRTFVLFHGTGGDEHDLVPFVEGIDPDATIVSLRGGVSENGMARFFKRHKEGVFDYEDIRHRAHEITECLREIYTEHKLSKDNVVALGFSNGANMISAMLLLGCDVFERAVLLRVMPPLDAPSSVDGKKIKTLLISGDSDPLISPDHARALREEFERIGVEVKHVTLPVSHGLSFSDTEHIRTWLSRIL